MPRVLITRLGQALLVVLLVVTTSFGLVRLAPGDPFLGLLSDETIPLETRQRMLERHGLDLPIPVQFGRFLADLGRGELGWSFSRSAPVGTVLARALPNTLLLMGVAFGSGLLLGVAAGAWQGWRPRSWSARVSDRLGLLVLSVPEFVVALFLVLGPALTLRWFPVGGMRDEFGPRGFAGLLDVLHHLALPAFTLAIVLAAIVARHQRAATLAVTGAEFVRAARAKGVPERRVFLRHALRNSLVPVIALAGVALPAVVGGAVVVEKIFAWPGMGTVTVDAVIARDYDLVVGSVLVTSACVVLGTLLADVAMLWADPRLRRPS